MIYDITAKIHYIGKTQAFGAKGFQKRNIVLLDDSGQYPDHYCLELTKDKCNLPDQLNLQIGQTITVGFAPSSREHNGNWYTSLRAINIKVQGGQQQQREMPPPPTTQQPPYQEPTKPTTDGFQQAEEEDSEVPF